MKTLLCAGLTGALLLSACTAQTAPTAQTVWSDEFSGTGLDAAKWTPQIGNGIMSGTEYVPGWGNNELEYYTGRPENVRV